MWPNSAASSSPANSTSFGFVLSPETNAKKGLMQPPVHAKHMQFRAPVTLASVSFEARGTYELITRNTGGKNFQKSHAVVINFLTDSRCTVCGKGDSCGCNEL